MSHVMQSLGHNKNPLFTEVCRDSREQAGSTEALTAY